MTDFEAVTIELPDDYEGAVVATLVKRPVPGSRRAVLYLHGFTDYFFQTHLADHFVERGVSFYALDLRKYGRSLLAHQTRGLVRSVTEYYPEIDAAVRLIRADHDELTINGHSTGGLVAALWADRVRGRGLVQALVLNSPFLDLNVPVLVRGAADALGGLLARLPATATLPVGVSTAYGASLHRDHSGEWEYDLELKPLRGFPVHAVWVAAIRRAHRRLHKGLRVDVPVLVLCSDQSLRVKDFIPGAQSADIVLDVEHIARWATRIGPRVTCVRVPGGVHDLVLSAEPVRERVFAEMDAWLAYAYQGKVNSP